MHESSTALVVHPLRFQARLDGRQDQALGNEAVPDQCPISNSSTPHQRIDWPKRVYKRSGLTDATSTFVK
jgi:hypothetical protein